MDGDSMVSLRNLLEKCRHVEKGLEYIEKELRNPQRLIYSKTQSNIENAESELQSFAEEVIDLKKEVKSEKEKFESCSKEFEEDSNLNGEFVKDIHKELKGLEANFMKYGYVPYTFTGKENEVYNTDLSGSSVNGYEQFENISPSVPDASVAIEETYILRRFNPNLDSSLLTTVTGNTTDIFDNSWNVDRNKKKPSTMRTTINPSIQADTLSKKLLCTPTDPGCSALSLEVTGRSVCRVKQNVSRWAVKLNSK